MSARGRLIDVSQTISESIAVWPGDTRFSREWVMRMDSGCSCNVSTVRMSLHTGTHADAPRHYREGAPAAADVDLDAYVGLCRVVTARGEDCVRDDDLDGIDFERSKRILFKTPRAVAATAWRDDFTSLGAGAARRLAEAGVKLVGIDTPSMDAMSSKTLGAHNILAAAGIAILENLRLDHVADGEYELMAFPLKIEGADSSPVRAVLRVL